MLNSYVSEQASRRNAMENATDNADELVEITPKSIRMRKKILETTLRKKYEAHHQDDIA